MTSATQEAEGKIERKTEGKKRGKTEGKPPTAQNPGFGNIDDDIPEEGLSDEELDALEEEDGVEVDDPVNDEDAPAGGPLIDDLDLKALKRRIIAAGQGSPLRICVRAVKPGKRGSLWPTRGFVTLADIEAAGSLVGAVRELVKGEAGNFVVDLVDATGRAVKTERKFVTVRDPKPSEDVLEIERQIQRTHKRTRLAEAEHGLREVQRKSTIDPLLDEIRALREEVVQLRGQQGKPTNDGDPVWLKVLSCAALAPLVERLFPKQSNQNGIDAVSDVMAKAVEVGLKARVDDDASRRNREDMLFERMLKMVSQKAGVPEEPEEDDSWFGMVKQCLEIVRPQLAAGAGTAAATTVPDPGERPRARPPSAFGRFTRMLLDGADGKMNPIAAADALRPVWRRMSEPERRALASKNARAMTAMCERLPEDVYARLGAAMVKPDVQAWYGSVLAELVNPGSTASATQASGEASSQAPAPEAVAAETN